VILIYQINQKATSDFNPRIFQYLGGPQKLIKGRKSICIKKGQDGKYSSDDTVLLVSSISQRCKASGKSDAGLLHLMAKPRIVSDHKASPRGDIKK
jgi:hypothetical protein